MWQTKNAPEMAQERCESTFGGRLAPEGFGVRCDLPAHHQGLHEGGGGAWRSRKRRDGADRTAADLATK